MSPMCGDRLGVVPSPPSLAAAGPARPLSPSAPTYLHCQHCLCQRAWALDSIAQSAIDPELSTRSSQDREQPLATHLPHPTTTSLSIHPADLDSANAFTPSLTPLAAPAPLHPLSLITSSSAIVSGPSSSRVRPRVPSPSDPADSQDHLSRKRPRLSNSPHLGSSAMHPDSSAGLSVRPPSSPIGTHPYARPTQLSFDALADQALDGMSDTHDRPGLHPSSSSSSLDQQMIAGPSNGHLVTNGHSHPTTNGFSNHPAVRRIEPPGRGMYSDSTVDREEFVRLVLQGLRDIGYHETVSTLESESGYTLESASVADFRECVLDGRWDRVEGGLTSLGVVVEEDIRYARFLVCEQKFLEYLERRQLDAALEVLRDEITPLQQDPQRTHVLSGLMMCDQRDLYSRAEWDGSAGSSRQILLTKLQRYIPSSIMIPPRRLETLLNQARQLQSLACIYHTSSRPFSLYIDHECDRSEFPLHTTMILAEHQDEVWHLAWSHDGRRLASASLDTSVIIWRIGADPSDCAVEQRLREHANGVALVAWSPDDSILLTANEATIKMWNPKTGLCMKTVLGHEETVCGLVWRPDGSGFISAGMDQKIFFWDKEGNQADRMAPIPVRVMSSAISPDERWLLVTGFLAVPMKGLSRTESTASSRSQSQSPRNPPGSQNPALAHKQNRLMIYDLKRKEEHASIPLTGEITSVTISADSKFALINHAPDEVLLWSLEEPKLVRKYTGQTQGNHVIRSCFGGAGENFVLSGSEDGNVYVWHKESGTPLEILQGHGSGSVNAVAWNPRQEAVFASCSDDHTVRIWGKDAPGFVPSVTDVVMEEGQMTAPSREPPTLRWDDTREMFL